MCVCCGDHRWKPCTWTKFWSDQYEHAAYRDQEQGASVHQGRPAAEQKGFGETIWYSRTDWYCKGDRSGRIACLFSIGLRFTFSNIWRRTLKCLKACRLRMQRRSSILLWLQCNHIKWRLEGWTVKLLTKLGETVENVNIALFKMVRSGAEIHEMVTTLQRWGSKHAFSAVENVLGVRSYGRQ